MVAFFRDWRPDAPPGTRRRYSSPSIDLLGHVAALALGRDFTDLVESGLFPALGLRRSFIRVPDAAVPGYAWGYARTNTPIRVNPGLLDAQAYGVKSTAADMIRFVVANLDPASLEGPLRRAVEGTKAGHFRVGEMVQGLGWESYPYPVPLERLLGGSSAPMVLEANPATRLSPSQRSERPVLFNKTGSTNGFGAYVAFVPARKVGLVMLENRNVPTPARIRAAHAIVERIAPGAA